MAHVIFSASETVSKLGSVPCTPIDGSWKRWWLRKSGKQWPEACCMFGCKNSATVGGHVWILMKIGHYILPMCKACNGNNLNLYLKVNAGSLAVPVLNKDATRALCCHQM